MNLFRVVLALATVGAAVSSANAEWLYSVDNSTARLCRVDPASGVVEVIGPLTGFNGSIMDLEFLGDRLFAVANVSPDKRLLELSTTTGAILSSVVITDGGTPIVHSAEGLGSDDKGNLFISYWFPGTNTALSSQIGLLGQDGVILFPMPLGRDMDGLCRRFAGGMFSLDRDPATNSNALFTVNHDPPSSSNLATIPFDAVTDGLDDLTQSRTGLYSLDYATRRAIRFDPATGAVVASVSYDPGFTFVVVSAPPPCLGDTDGDRDRDFADVTRVLEFWGAPVPSFGSGDSDGDGDVDFADITKVLENWGAPCP